MMEALSSLGSRMEASRCGTSAVSMSAASPISSSYHVHNLPSLFTKMAVFDRQARLHSCAGKFGRSAAVGQVAAPKAQMLGKQDWSYVSGARQLLHGAHGQDDDVTSLKLSADGSTLLSRSEDATLKVLATSSSSRAAL